MTRHSNISRRTVEFMARSDDSEIRLGAQQALRDEPEAIMWFQSGECDNRDETGKCQGHEGHKGNN